MAAALICSIQLKTAYEIINSRTSDFGSAHTTRIKDRHITHRVFIDEQTSARQSTLMPHADTLSLRARPGAVLGLDAGLRKHTYRHSENKMVAYVASFILAYHLIGRIKAHLAADLLLHEQVGVVDDDARLSILDVLLGTRREELDPWTDGLAGLALPSRSVHLGELPLWRDVGGNRHGGGTSARCDADEERRRLRKIGQEQSAVEHLC